MRILPTTQTLVKKIKAQGRVIARDRGIPLGHGHDEAARLHGYDDFHHVSHCLAHSTKGGSTPAREESVGVEAAQDHRQAERATATASKDYTKNPRAYFSYLESLGLADVTHNPLKADVFVDITVEGQRFQAALSGPYPVIIGGLGMMDWVQYGVSSIALAARTNALDEEAGWAVCKYSDQYRVGLRGLSPAGLRRVAVELGLTIEPWEEQGPAVVGEDPGYAANELEAFYQSKVFDAMVEWAKRHPRKIKKLGWNEYTHDWAERAAEAATRA